MSTPNADTNTGTTNTNPEVTHNPERDPSDWVTGGEPSTGPQESYLSSLAKQAGEETPTGLTKAQASEEIERLQAETGRGTGGGSGANNNAVGGSGSDANNSAAPTQSPDSPASDTQVTAAQDPA